MLPVCTSMYSVAVLSNYSVVLQKVWVFFSCGDHTVTSISAQATPHSRESRSRSQAAISFQRARPVDHIKRYLEGAFCKRQAKRGQISIQARKVRHEQLLQLHERLALRVYDTSNAPSSSALHTPRAWGILLVG